MVDTDTQALLRMDPATRRVTARFPLGGSMNVTPGQGAMWVGLTQNSRSACCASTRARNRVVARLRTPDVPGGSTGSVPVVVGNNLWLVSAEAAVRIDPANGHAIATVHTARNGYQTRSLAVVDGDLWVQVSDGRLLRLDGATGRRKATFHVPDGSLVGDFWMNGLFVVDQATLSRVDPRNLHVLWRTPIPSIGPGVAADGRLWVEAPDRQGDRVLTVDPRNGQRHRQRPRRGVRRAVDGPRRLRGLDDHGRRPRGHPGSLAVQASCCAQTRSHSARRSAASTSGSCRPKTSASAANHSPSSASSRRAGPAGLHARERARPQDVDAAGIAALEGRGAHEARLRRGRQPLVRGRELGRRRRLRVDVDDADAVAVASSCSMRQPPA